MKVLLILFISLFSINLLAQEPEIYLLDSLVDGSTVNDRIHNASVFNQALSYACTENRGKIVFPQGDFHFAPINIISCSNIEIFGNSTKLIFYPVDSLNETSFFVFNGTDNCKIDNLEIENKGSKSILNGNCYNGLTELSASSSSIQLINCTNTEIKGCTLKNGANGIRIENSLTDIQNNVVVEGNSLTNQASYSLFLINANSCIIKNNFLEKSGTDGLKTSRSKHITITNNIARLNGRDGFDLYDGLTNSIVSNNQSISNCFQGFDIKGTPGPGSSEYLVRDIIVSVNLAQDNGTNGFLLTSIRYITLTSNNAVNNNQNGFFFNNVQNFNLNGNTSSKNNSNGFLFNTVSRGLVNSNLAVDNDVDNASTTSAGFQLVNNADGIVFNGNVAFNGTTIEKGHQKYGIHFDASCNANIVNANKFTGNESGNFGGDAALQHFNFNH